MKQGPKEAKVLANAKRRGMPIPKAIQDAPSLIKGLALYRDGFKDLNSERNANNVIPWSAIHYYCIALKLSEDQTESMHYLIVEMDEVYQKWMDSENKKSKDK